MRIAVYTSITGRKDTLKEKQTFRGAEFLAFTDIRKSRSGWQFREPCSRYEDPNRNAKIHKVLAHRYLSDFDYSLWIDATIRLLQPVEELIERYLADSDIAVFAHHARNCTYVEAESCIKKKLDNPVVIRDQMERYRALGFPEELGLYAGTVILRRHTPQTEHFNEMWWSEISQYSRRDQLSLRFVLWKLGITPATFPGTVYSSPSIVRWHMHRGLSWPPSLRPKRAKDFVWRMLSGFRKWPEVSD
jgi:hypothetical protein